MPFDFKKEYKDLYLPNTKPGVIDVPEMVFIMIDGKGNPNTSAEYSSAVEALYGLSWTIKMSKTSETQPKGYFDFIVPPLEGMWWLDDGSDVRIKEKVRYCWTSMIRQPDFVDDAVFETVKIELARKKPHIDTSRARLEKFTEGLCVQALHIGTYDDEPRTNAAIGRFMADNGYIDDISDTRRHHEIYLSDPRKTAPEKIKTVLRHPVRKNS